ncbi:murein L,D-transpeptidase catalytic domain family protein, partial [Xanthomonas citri]
MSDRMIAVAAVLCGWAAAGAASAADALAGSPVPPLGAPRVGLVEALARQAPSLDRQVLALATEALQCARQHQQVGAERVLSVIDYSRPSTERRLWVFDLDKQRLLFREWVAHGRNTGENLAAKFSNNDGSFQSSLGAFTAQESYTGHNGYSLRLKGLEPGFNDHARDRAIVIHGAPYVSEAIIRTQGRLGRSLGC